MFFAFAKKNASSRPLDFGAASSAASRQGKGEVGRFQKEKKKKKKDKKKKNKEKKKKKMKKKKKKKKKKIVMKAIAVSTDIICILQFYDDCSSVI